MSFYIRTEKIVVGENLIKKLPEPFSAAYIASRQDDIEVGLIVRAYAGEYAYDQTLLLQPAMRLPKDLQELESLESIKERLLGSVIHHGEIYCLYHI
ncbi:MAG: hypothetical protein WAX89_08060 [Alphaproteobacteria bacterium]